MPVEQRLASLYKQMLRASNNFTDYNFRTYFVRRVKEEFKKSESLSTTEEKEKFITESEKTLGMLERQSAISQAYKGLKLPIE